MIIEKYWMYSGKKAQPIFFQFLPLKVSTAFRSVSSCWHMLKPISNSSTICSKSRKDKRLAKEISTDQATENEEITNDK